MDTALGDGHGAADGSAARSALWGLAGFYDSAAIDLYRGLTYESSKHIYSISLRRAAAYPHYGRRPAFIAHSAGDSPRPLHAGSRPDGTSGADSAVGPGSPAK